MFAPKFSPTALFVTLGSVLVSLSCWGTPSDTSTPITLLDAYYKARDSAPELAIARYRVDGAESQRDVARGRVLPQVSVFGQW